MRQRLASATVCHRVALANHQSGNARVFVVTRDDRVVGYYALATATCVKEEAPGGSLSGVLLRNASIALKSVTGCLKTYVMLFAEADRFAHLHVHVVPRMADQPEDRRGPSVFGYLQNGRPVTPERRDQICGELLSAWPH